MSGDKTEKPPGPDARLMATVFSNQMALVALARLVAERDPELITEYSKRLHTMAQDMLAVDTDKAIRNNVVADLTWLSLAVLEKDA